MRDGVIHVCSGPSPVGPPWPLVPAPTIPHNLWWCEGEDGCEGGEFALVLASSAYEAVTIALADYRRQTQEDGDREAWFAIPATALHIIAWWRRVQYPSLDDPDCDDDDCDDDAICAECGRQRPVVDVEYGHSFAPCCLWWEAWREHDCDGDRDCDGVALLPVLRLESACDPPSPEENP